jgi:hypothetical protein
MGHEVLNCCPQGALTKQDQPFQTGFLDAAYKSFGVRIQIRRSWRQFDRFPYGQFIHAARV